MGTRKMEPSSSLNDIVYFVKDGDVNEELVYSIRSVVENFPHRKIWIYGGKPKNIKEGHYVPFKQFGETKWDKVKGMFASVCLNSEITDDFFLFNDDFFVINKVDKFEIYCRCPLPEHIVTIEQAYNDAPTLYTKQLRRTYYRLVELGMPTMSYELHMPMLFNKARLLQTIGAFSDYHCTRSLYGNYFNIGGIQHADVKVYDKSKQNFDENFYYLSTDDNAWIKDVVGVKSFIQKKFPNKSEYEL